MLYPSLSNKLTVKSEENPPKNLVLLVKWAILTLPFVPNLASVALLISMAWIAKGYTKEIVRSPINKGFGIISVCLILTTIFAVKPIPSLEGLANFLPFILFFVLYRCLFKTFDHLYQLAWWLILSSIPVTLVGFLQLFGWESGSFLQVLGSKVIAYGTPEGRMSSTLMYANLLAAFLIIPFILAIALMIIHYRQDREKSTPILNRKQLILGLSIILNGISLILTNSRSAWGLLFLIVIAYAVYLGWHWLLWLLGGFATAVLWSAWGPFGKEPLRQVIPAYFWARLSDELYPDRYMTAYRTTQWQVAWEMWLQRPWLGWGLRNFTPYYQIRMNTWLGHPHNLYVMLLAEMGVIGTVLFCGLIGFILGQGVYFYRNLTKYAEKTLLFAYLLAFFSCILFNVLDVTVFDFRVNLTNWLILAAISGVVSYQQQTPKNHETLNH
ncbi:MAG: O-antigen ligase family protein [Microcystaceae cyanobacterium]